MNKKNVKYTNKGLMDGRDDDFGTFIAARIEAEKAKTINQASEDRAFFKNAYLNDPKARNSANCEKVLYDIFPIEKVEGVGTSTTLSTDGTIPQSNGKNQAQSQLREKAIDYDQKFVE